ncbi:radical SAM protein [bacterium]|nr:radical SAM protein [bacterium]
MDCHLLSHGISVEKNDLHDCCLTHLHNGRPFIIELNQNKTVNWEKVFELKHSLKNHKRTTEKNCVGCRLLTDERDYDKDNDYISHINLNHWNICNSRCIYCTREYNGGDKYYNILPMMKELFEYNGGKNIVFYGELTFQGGEPTMLPEFEELLRMFTSKKMPVRIHSSGIKYSPAIENGLNNNTVTLIISPDTANPETYKKIKRVDCCERVWQNLENYAKAVQEENRLKAKFIIIPGYNDSIDEVDNFIKRAKSIGINRLVWEIEGSYGAVYNYDIPNIGLLLDYAVNQTLLNNLTYEYYDGAIYVQNKRNSEKNENMEYFNKKYEILKEKYKFRNLDYSIYND